MSLLIIMFRFYACMCMGICGGQRSALTVFLHHSVLIIWDRVSNWTWTPLIRLDWPESLRDLLSPHPRAGIAGSCCLCWCFLMRAEGSTPVSVTAWPARYQLALPPVSVLVFTAPLEILVHSDRVVLSMCLGKCIPMKTIYINVWNDW